MTEYDKLIEALKEMCDPPIPDRDMEVAKKVIAKLPIKADPEKRKLVKDFVEGNAIDHVDLRDSGITTIRDYLFLERKNIKTIAFPENITSIGKSAFEGCSSLVIDSIPSGITRIEEAAFLNCYSIESLDFEGDISYISERAFDGCYEIKKCAFLNNTTVPENYCLFDSIDENCKIVVPDSLYEEWISADGWTDLSSHIIKQSDNI